ncbi:MAG: heparinase II/III family protein, partial [Acetobacterium woodii]|nr:heparinase II/III family protein [Acetobacterium woodii]
RSDYSNQFYYFDGMLAITGIALYNEGVDDSLALTYLKTFDNYLHNNMIPTINQVGGKNGGWHEGLGYVDRAMTYFTFELEAWRVGAGENLFSQAAGLKGLSKWLFYSTQPDGNVVNISDVTGWPEGWGDQAARRAVLLGARFKDGFSQYIANSISPTISRNWSYMVFYLLWYDSSVPAVDPSAIDTAEYFDGVGWISMRSSWDSNAIFAMFYSGNFYFGHQHKDQNSFMIFKNAPLAIDNGIYNVGTPNYKWATRYHNTIIVGNPGSETSIEDGDAGQSGASPMYYISNPEDSSSDKGDILLFDNDPNFTYTAGDASKAYSAGRLTTYIRKFLYLKPDYFVILDRVAVPTANYPIRWLLQSENNPEISESQIKITNGSGRLFSKTLLPNSVSISINTVFSGMPRYGGGNYRIEVVPTVNKSEEYFLHVLWVTDSKVTAMPPVQLLSSTSGNLVGTQFSNYAVLLSKKGTIETEETYSVPATGVLKHLIGDLTPQGLYEIYQNGNLIMTKVSSNGGTLQFSSTGGGIFILKARYN